MHGSDSDPHRTMSGQLCQTRQNFDSQHHIKRGTEKTPQALLMLSGGVYETYNLQGPATDESCSSPESVSLASIVEAAINCSAEETCAPSTLKLRLMLCNLSCSTIKVTGGGLGLLITKLENLSLVEVYRRFKELGSGLFTFSENR